MSHSSATSTLTTATTTEYSATITPSLLLCCPALILCFSPVDPYCTCSTSSCVIDSSSTSHTPSTTGWSSFMLPPLIVYRFRLGIWVCLLSFVGIGFRWLSFVCFCWGGIWHFRTFPYVRTLSPSTILSCVRRTARWWMMRMTFRVWCFPIFPPPLFRRVVFRTPSWSIVVVFWFVCCVVVDFPGWWFNWTPESAPSSKLPLLHWSLAFPTDVLFVIGFIGWCVLFFCTIP